MSAAAIEPLPWHRPVWQKLLSAWTEHRWPHGLLIHGPEGVGKHALATRIASALLCDRQNAFAACGECASCKLLLAGTHPDFMAITPEEDKQQISVDRIREASAQLALTSYRNGYKVAIVQPAHQMTPAAANSLLKTLEEPPPRTALILLTSRPGALLATLRSRCQQLKLASPSESDALAWLATRSKQPISPRLLRFANGAPLRALALADGQFQALWEAVTQDIASLLAGKEDVTHIAKRWADEQLVDRLTCVDHWITETLRAAIVGTDDPITRTPLPINGLQLNISRPQSRLWASLDRLRALQAQLSKTALQRELAVDSLLIDLLDAMSRGAVRQ